MSRFINPFSFQYDSRLLISKSKKHFKHYNDYILKKKETSQELRADDQLPHETYNHYIIFSSSFFFYLSPLPGRILQQKALLIYSSID